jgi:hypothetical protein
MLAHQEEHRVLFLHTSPSLLARSYFSARVPQITAHSALSNEIVGKKVRLFSQDRTFIKYLSSETFGRTFILSTADKVILTSFVYANVSRVQRQNRPEVTV